MAFNSTNPVTVGLTVLKSHYDRVFDNTTQLFSTVLGLVGDTDTVIDAIHNTVVFDGAGLSEIKNNAAGRDKSVVLIGGSSAAGGNADATFVAYGKSHAGSRSGIFVARTNASNPWEFIGDDGSTVWFRVASTKLELGSALDIKRTVRNSAIALIGGTTQASGDSDSYIQLNGTGFAGTSAGKIVMRTISGPGDVTFEIINAHTGGDVTTHEFKSFGGASKLNSFTVFRRGSTGDYARVTAAGADGSEYAGLEIFRSTARYGSMINVAGTVDVRIFAEQTNADLQLYAKKNIVILAGEGGSNRAFTFSADGQLEMPLLSADPSSIAEGNIWYRDDLNQLRIVANGITYKFDMTAA